MAKKTNIEDLAEAAGTSPGEETANETAELMKEKAAKFFKDFPNYAGDFVYVTSNGDIFAGDIKGFNHLTNHLSTPEGKSATWTKIAK